MTIRKGTVVFTFTFDDALISVDAVNEMGVREIIEECTYGSMLDKENWGDYIVIEVPEESVVSEEVALNCEG